MPKKTEAARSTPNVIARLMGLDGLPSQQPIHRQQQKLNGEQSTAPKGPQSRVHLCYNRSCRKSSTDQQEFKDVFEDLEASHVINQRHCSIRTVNLKETELEVAYVQHRSKDAKHLTTDRTVRGPDELDSMVEPPNSNNDLMLKLQQPDSLFVKHLRGVQGSPSCSPCNQIAVLKPSNSENFEAKAKGRRSDRIAKKHGIGSTQIHEKNLMCDSYNSYSSHKSLKSSINRIDRKDERASCSTSIVILKPNFAKTSSNTKSISSPDFLHANVSDCRKHTECSCAYMRQEGCLGKADFSHDEGLSRSNTREAREIAKTVTMELREAFGRMMVSFPYSGIREFDGVEKSYNVSGSDSPSESEVTTMTSINSSDKNNRCKRSYSSTDSLVSREAKKRLSERWKMAQRHHNVGVVGKNSTLREMLSSPDRDVRILDPTMGMDGSRDVFLRINETTRWDPLGISSRDGWKNRYSMMPSRLRSLPPLDGSRSHKVIPKHEDRLHMPKEAMHVGRSKKAAKEKFNEEEEYSSKILRSTNRKSRSGRVRYSCSANSVVEIHPSQNGMEIKLEKQEPPEEQCIVWQTANSVTSIVDSVANAEDESIKLSPVIYNEMPPSRSPRMLNDGNSSGCDQEDSTPQESIGPCEIGYIVQCSGPEPESSESSKEADHLSPVSVLEVPSREDMSSGSECFEQVCASLHELRMQLQLLKMESDPCAEIPILIGSDNMQGSSIAFEDNVVVRAECWESSYIADVLIDSGFNYANYDIFMTTWHSPDCPLGPWVFDNLEKKYRGKTTGMRHERRLLFDRINSAYWEISRSFIDSFPWVMRPTTVGFCSKWQKCGISDAVVKLLGIQEKEANGDISGQQLDKEMHWLEPRDDIDVLGMEIEKLLIDDLITELVIM